MRTTSYGIADAMIASKELKAPLVIIKRIDDGGKITYAGFVPGFVANDIIDENIETVKTKLEKFAKERIVDMLNNKKPFPFFPTKEEILNDFENVEYVKFLKLK